MVNQIIPTNEVRPNGVRLNGIKLILLIAGLVLGFSLGGRGFETTVQAAPTGGDVIVNLGGDIIKHGSPAAADFNNDGDKEIVVGTYDGRLAIIAYNGSSWGVADTIQVADAINAVLPAGEPRQSTGRIDTAPAIGDIDADGKLEIVVTTGGLPESWNVPNNRHGSIIAYEVNSGNLQLSLKSGWPHLTLDLGGQGSGGSTPDGIRDGIWAAPALGDLDGDGDLEIVAEGIDRRIYALEHTGTAVSGWPVSRDNGDPILRGGWSSPAVADIDGDGLDEVIVGTDSPPWNGDGGGGPFPPQYNSPDYTKSTIWALNGDSSLVPGWPVITEQLVKSSPAVGDIDGDGDPEIVSGTGGGIAGTGGYKVYAWHHTGAPVSGWPRPTGGDTPAAPALADLDGDNVLDVISGCGTELGGNCHNIYAWRGDGSSIPGFPIKPLYNGQTQVHPYGPIVADLDGDGQMEILLHSNYSSYLALIDVTATGATTRSSYNRSQSGATIQATPLVDDVDNDGSLETIVGGANSGGAAVHIWQETGTVGTAQMPWATFHRDMARTGLFLAPQLAFADEIRFFHQEGSGNTAVLQATIFNEGGSEIEWQINESIDRLSANQTSGTVTDATSVTLTLNTNGLAPNQWHNLGSLTVTGTSDGTAVNGSPQTATIYAYVGDIGRVYLPSIQK